MSEPRTHRIVAIPGDGIGLEIMAAVQCVLDATGVPIEWIMAEAGLGCLERTGAPLPDATLALLREHKVGIKGPTMTPTGTGFRSVNVRLREELELFAGVRPVRTIPGLVHPLSALERTIDLVIIRENLEDLYVGIEGSFATAYTEQLRLELSDIFSREIPPHASVALKIITPERTKRIVRFAFEYARAHRRRKVTCVHKANILKQTDGLFLSLFRTIAQEYPDIAADDFIIDAAAMRLVRNPEQFDVLVCPNLYGDILSDLCAALVGGLGVVPGANIGEEIALFEAVHGTAPDIAGQGKANPTALLLSAVMMLEHIEETSAANLVARAVREVIAEGDSITADIVRVGGTDGGFPSAVPASTQEMATAIADRIRRLRSPSSVL